MKPNNRSSIVNATVKFFAMALMTVWRLCMNRKNLLVLPTLAPRTVIFRSGIHGLRALAADCNKSTANETFSKSLLRVVAFVKLRISTSCAKRKLALSRAHFLLGAIGARARPLVDPELKVAIVILWTTQRTPQIAQVLWRAEDAHVSAIRSRSAQIRRAALRIASFITVIGLPVHRKALDVAMLLSMSIPSVEVLTVQPAVWSAMIAPHQRSLMNAGWKVATRLPILLIDVGGKANLISYSRKKFQ